MDVSKIAGNLVRCVSSGEMVELRSLWATQTAVVVFLQLFIDAKQTCYKEMGFKRYNVISVLKGLMAGETKQSLARANSKNIKGNFRGDGLQNGGMLIVTAGGKEVLLSFKQSSPGDHVSNERILQLLGIEADQAADDGASAGAVAPSEKTKDAGASGGQEGSA